ncbi:MAG: hypothetical protein H7099_05135 [Gemmatimonadaceae bacterium]|nr:hypothetical protein [Gemmatimonadaceae bacterium]
MTPLTFFGRFAGLVVFASLAACASSPVDIDASYDSASPNSVRLKTLTVSVTAGPSETLFIGATLQNGTSTELRRLGCTRPELALDSATATGGWVELSATQSESLAQCVSPYYIVAAGTTQAFETGFMRNSPARTFPRGVALRLRLVGPTPESGPTAPIILP